MSEQIYHLAEVKSFKEHARHNMGRGDYVETYQVQLVIDGVEQTVIARAEDNENIKVKLGLPDLKTLVAVLKLCIEEVTQHNAEVRSHFATLDVCHLPRLVEVDLSDTKDWTGCVRFRPAPPQKIYEALVSKM